MGIRAARLVDGFPMLRKAATEPLGGLVCALEVGNWAIERRTSNGEHTLLFLRRSLSDGQATSGFEPALVRTG